MGIETENNGDCSRIGSPRRPLNFFHINRADCEKALMVVLPHPFPLESFDRRLFFPVPTRRAWFNYRDHITAYASTTKFFPLSFLSPEIVDSTYFFKPPKKLFFGSAIINQQKLHEQAVAWLPRGQIVIRV